MARMPNKVGRVFIVAQYFCEKQFIERMKKDNYLETVRLFIMQVYNVVMRKCPC
jgi:hypothetical protein